MDRARLARASASCWVFGGSRGLVVRNNAAVNTRTRSWVSRCVQDRDCQAQGAAKLVSKVPAPSYSPSDNERGSRAATSLKMRPGFHLLKPVRLVCGPSALGTRAIPAPRTALAFPGRAVGRLHLVSAEGAEPRLGVTRPLLLPVRRRVATNTIS